MTIGIAAAGPGAGRAILGALAAAEGFATGAIGGFLSFAALGARGEVLRAGVQRGGASALLEAAGLPAGALAAERAVLMSSGPDRPEPLSQFTPGRDGLGLATGHRFPNMPGADGRPLGEAALDLLAAGRPPDAAVRDVVDGNPAADAGLIVLDLQGRIALGNTAYVSRFSDAGAAEARCDDLAVAVLHNAIRPSRSLAPLIVELVADVMSVKAEPAGSILLRCGLPVEHGLPGAIVVDDMNRAIAVRLPTPDRHGVPVSAGFGPHAPVLRDGKIVGHAVSEPYLVLRDGCIRSVDGQSETRVAFVSAP